MSHLSKIKTNIYSIDILKKTLSDLGFFYNSISKVTDIYGQGSNCGLNVFNSSKKKVHIFSFIWNGMEYELVADLQFWNLEISIEYFMEKLTQQYAYNIILHESISNGFNQKIQTTMEDGSLKVIMERCNFM